MEVYRLLQDCCVCGKRIMVMQRRYELGGITAHQACADHVNAAALRDECQTLSVVAFREKMRHETQEIDKR